VHRDARLQPQPITRPGSGAVSRGDYSGRLAGRGPRAESQRTDRPGWGCSLPTLAFSYRGFATMLLLAAKPPSGGFDASAAAAAACATADAVVSDDVAVAWWGAVGVRALDVVAKGGTRDQAVLNHVVTRGLAEISGEDHLLAVGVDHVCLDERILGARLKLDPAVGVVIDHVAQDLCGASPPRYKSSDRGWWGGSAPQSCARPDWISVSWAAP
jgi:hypothetical protein